MTETAAETLPATASELTLAQVQELLEQAPVVSGKEAWRLAAVQEALAAERGTPARAVAIATAAAACGMSARHLRRLVAMVERDGPAALYRAPHPSRGRRRVAAWRQFDRHARAAGGDAATVAGIWENARRELRSYYAEFGEIGAPTLAGLVRDKVHALAREAGLAVPLEACRPPAHLVRGERLYRLLGIKRHDAGRWSSEFAPRIMRHRKGLVPGEHIAGDVMHGNVWFRRPDGTECTPKLIAWLDFATGRMRVDVLVPRQGEGTRQEHLCRSIKGVAADPAWGIPSWLYADNGSEYGWADLVEPLSALKVGLLGSAAAPGTRPGLRRALPYGPQAKGIESVFASFQKTLERVVPGFIGGRLGRRMVEHQGRPPRPFPGDEAALVRAIRQAVALWNAKPADGHLDGLSPDDAFKAFVESGWRPQAVLDPAHADMHLARRETRVIGERGALRVDGRHWYADPLTVLVGERVEVRIPYDPSGERIYVLHHGKCVAIAAPELPFGLLDPAGAGERARRVSAQNAILADMRGDVDRVDRLALLEERAGALPPAPELPEAEIVIGLDPGLQAQSDALAAAQAARRAALVDWSEEALWEENRAGWAEMARGRKAG